MRSFTQKLMMFMAALMCSVSMSVSAQVLNEGFEDSSFPPEDWSAIHVRGVVEWTRNTSYKHAGDASAYANYDASAGHEDYLVTPKLTPAAGDTLSFFVASQSYAGTSLSIEVSTTDAAAASFTTVLETYTTGGSGTIGTTSPSMWVEKRIPMEDYVGQDIFIAFHITDDNGSAVYIDDVTGVTLHVVTCPKPATIAVSNITEASATISWTAGGSETQWQYVLTDVNAAADWTNATIATQPSVTLTGLTANTAYDFHVRAYCSAAEQSDAKLTSFRTKCEAITTFPWSEDFEAMAQNSEIDAPCWGNVHITGNGGYRFRSYSLSSTGNTTRMCQLPDMSAGTITDLTLPAMNIPEANAYEFILTMYRSANYSGYTDEGLRIFAVNGSDTAVLAFISRNPTQAYVVDETVIIPNEGNVGWYTYNLTIPYSGFTSIVIRGESQYGAATYFDNLIVREKPSCMQPSVPEVSNITDASAMLTWTPAGAETQWQYVLGDGSDWTNAVVVNQATVTLTGLTSNLTYDFTVRAYCSESEQSEARTISFRTNCGAVAVPYTEGFEEMATGSSSSAAPTCWNLLNANDGAYPYIYVNTSSSYVKSGSQSLYFVSSSSRYGYAILPAVNVPLNTLKIAFAHKEENASSSGKLDLGYMTDVNNEESFVSIVQYTRSNSWQNEETMLNTIPNEVASTARLAFRYGGASSNYYMGIDDIVIDVLPNCIKPANVTVTNITPNTAEINCVAGASETAWTVQYRTSADENWTIATASTTMPYTLSGLTANTAYEIQVAAVCSETETSDWTNTVAFRTACEVATLPYVDGFEDGIYCWTVGNMQSTNSSYIPSAYSSESYSHNGTYSLRLNAYVYTSTYSSPTNADSAYAVLPVMNYGAEGISAHRLRFYARQNSSTASYNNHLYVGTLTDPADMSTFTLVQDVVVEGTTYQQYEVSFANYAGEGQYIVLLAAINPEATATSRYGSFYVDDLMVDLIPNCLRPTDVTVSNITANGAEITCVAGANETAWAVRYKAAADEDWTVATASTTMPYALTNLAANTAYQVEVAAVCSETETSEWTEPVNFRTACDVEAIPYTENFENGIYCWTVGNMQSESSSYIPSAYNGATYAHDGTYSLRLNAYKTSSTDADSAYAIMPAMNYGVKGLSGHTLKFYARQSSTSTYYSYYNQLMIGVVSNPADMSTFTLVRAEEVTGAT
ncbi:MAG: choice-of-anchor J domain-containing protein, partial [Bacteroidales bacterium]|nr:choice-of-anchor J domain-containing protein [Bacteroidales bacterium]